MTLRWPAVWILGAGQTVFWGIAYYTFSVLLVPMREELGASSAVIAGAFSVGLGMAAMVATHVGRWVDAGHGVALMRGGALAGGALLLAWSAATNVVILYAVWAVLGACMALILYETAFALVTRAMSDPQRRLSALASVTVMGGLASTLFLPLAGAATAHWGWRATLRGLAILWFLAALIVDRFALRAVRAAESHAMAQSRAARVSLPDARLVALAGLPFVATTFASMALTTLVIPMLVDRGQPLERAAWVLGAFGVMQLPGRLWLWRGTRAVPAGVLLVAPVLLQAAGLAVLSVSSELVVAFVGVATFGIGAGLHTLARPWLVPHLFGVGAAGRVNGSIARAQGIARAAGPFCVAAAYERTGSAPVFAVLALALAALWPLASWTARRASSRGASALA